MARQADGVTPLKVEGEIHCELTRGKYSFILDALVVDKLDVDVLAGTPFLTRNDIATRPARHQIVIQGSDVVHYGRQQNSNATVRRTQSYLLRAPAHQTVLLPGDYIELSSPLHSTPDTLWALEPRMDSSANIGSKASQVWPSPQEVQSVGHAVRVMNNSLDPIIIRRNEHIAEVRSIEATSATMPPPPQQPTTKTAVTPFSSAIVCDPDNAMPLSTRQLFHDLHKQYDNVFNPAIAKYNGASGKIQAVVNMGTVKPPQRKGRLPQYNREASITLQEKFDELEAAGVFAKPEDVNIVVEYLNLSFLVRKPNGGSRLVTSFGEVGQYSKPQPSLMPNVDGVLRDIARWKYMVITDLLQSFYQIPLARDSMKYCGVATPFKGIRVYTRSAMGMPGSETCLEEMMCRVLGDLIQEGCVAKIADDLYCGGNTYEEVLQNWSRVLAELKRNNLRLSARKTIVCPRSATILGWIWENGTLRASPHKLSALASVDPPKTVQSLRSFIGAYKVLSRVLKGYSDLLNPLDQMVAGKQSREQLNWSDENLADFLKAKQALLKAETITLPKPNDTLWIVTDASVSNFGIAATMYILRDKSLKLAGFFNAKLKKHQVTWLPCEVEALCIGASIKHFSPYISQSSQQTQLLTDSKPCVQAVQKLNRGEFSNSARVTTFLSNVSRYSIAVRHIAGAANLPSDYGNRNPLSCPNSDCQICKFVQTMEDSVIRSLSVKEVLDNSARMPFTSR